MPEGFDRDIGGLCRSASAWSSGAVYEGSYSEADPKPIIERTNLSCRLIRQMMLGTLLLLALTNWPKCDRMLFYGSRILKHSLSSSFSTRARVLWSRQGRGELLASLGFASFLRNNASHQLRKLNLFFLIVLRSKGQHVLNFINSFHAAPFVKPPLMKYKHKLTMFFNYLIYRWFTFLSVCASRSFKFLFVRNGWCAPNAWWLKKKTMNCKAFVVGLLKRLSRNCIFMVVLVEKK